MTFLLAASARRASAPGQTADAASHPGGKPCGGHGGFPSARRQSAARRRRCGSEAMNYLRTAILLAGLTALFMAIGYLIGGAGGAMIALFIAAGMNLVTYWNADRLVLSMHDAHEVDETTAPDLVRLVRDLARNA